MERSRCFGGICLKFTPYRYCFNSPVNYVDPHGLYEVISNEETKITDAGEISSLLNYISQGGMTATTNEISSYITANFELSLPEVTVYGNSDKAYQDAGDQISKSQSEALNQAGLGGGNEIGNQDRLTSGFNYIDGLSQISKEGLIGLLAKYLFDKIIS